MSDHPSPYYPPRARWHRHLYQVAYAWRRQLHLDQIKLPIQTTVPRFFTSLVLPGFAFIDGGWRRIGAALLFSWMLAGLIFFVWLGHGSANVAFGMMMSMHVSSILFLMNRAWPGMRIRDRLVLSLAVLGVVGQLVYASGLSLLQDRWFMPLKMGDKVYVIDRKALINQLRVGDLAAYQSEGSAGSGVRIRGGYLLDRILASPGDQVNFGAAAFLVNGVAHPVLPLMPEKVQITVPQNTWLIWPTLHIVTRNNVTQESISRSVLDMALVPRKEIIGRPFKRWFWRTQTQ